MIHRVHLELSAQTSDHHELGLKHQSSLCHGHLGEVRHVQVSQQLDLSELVHRPRCLPLSPERQEEHLGLSQDVLGRKRQSISGTSIDQRQVTPMQSCEPVGGSVVY